MNARSSSPSVGKTGRFPTPRDMTPEQFREVRSLIESKVKELIATL
jgi:hypothetical protein